MKENDFTIVQMDELIIRALREDIATGDRTTACLVDPGLSGGASVIAKEELILAGVVPFKRVFEILNPAVEFLFSEHEGALVENGAVVAGFQGPLAALLTGERTALNFLQHLSGIATLAAQFAEKIRPYGVTLLDTRKTIPGLRVLEKAAVRIGGGINHRFSIPSIVPADIPAFRAISDLLRNTCSRDNFSKCSFFSWPIRSLTPPTLRHSFQGPSCLSHITYKELYGIGYLKSRRLLSKEFFQG